MLLHIRITGISVVVLVGFLLFIPLAHAQPAIDLKIIGMIESGGDPYAVNVATRCYGLYQISEICLEDYNEAHQSRYAIKDLFRAEINERVASWYFMRISEMLHAYHIPVTVATLIASYNWGIGHVRTWFEQGMKPEGLPAETRRYISKYKAGL